MMKIYTKLSGTGAYFPEKVVTNFDLEKIVDTTDSWIVSRSGIHSRHMASASETTSYMGYVSSKRAIEASGLVPNDIDGIIFSTITPDRIMPSCACTVQKLLEIKDCFAFDISPACSGFTYALTLADSLIQTGKYKHILIVTSELLTRTLNWKDRASCVLFGDGSGAVVVSATETDTSRLHFVDMKSDGRHGDILTLNAIGLEGMKRNQLHDESLLLSMEGKEVYRLAVRNMANIAETAVKNSGLKLNEIDYLVPHQANIRIIEAVAKRLKLPLDRAIINLDRRGNVSAASIVTALDEGIRSGTLQKGNNIVGVTFGGGATWGAFVLTL